MATLRWAALIGSIVVFAACATPANTTPDPITSAPSVAPSTPVTPQSLPTIERKILSETRSMPYPEKVVEDPSIEVGKRIVRIRGVNGVMTLTYEVTITNGVQTSRALVNETITTAPVVQVIAVGTKVKAPPASNCDPNYAGACVPIASDVDCAGGRGNGPAYVRGPVTVIGIDIYGLDSDNDGIGCE